MGVVAVFGLVFGVVDVDGDAAGAFFGGAVDAVVGLVFGEVCFCSARA
jgi:hypothetical protein